MPVNLVVDELYVKSDLSNWIFKVIRSLELFYDIESYLFKQCERIIHTTFILREIMDKAENMSFEYVTQKCIS